MSPTVEMMRRLLEAARFVTPELEQQRVTTLETFDAETEPSAWRRLRCESLWRSDDPPKDGTVIVAIGNITEDCGDGAFNVEPFTASIYWEDGEWVGELGLTLAPYDDCNVTVLHWICYPHNDKIQP